MSLTVSSVGVGISSHKIKGSLPRPLRFITFYIVFHTCSLCIHKCMYCLGIGTVLHCKINVKVYSLLFLSVLSLRALPLHYSLLSFPSAVGLGIFICNITNKFCFLRFSWSRYFILSPYRPLFKYLLLAV